MRFILLASALFFASSASSALAQDGHSITIIHEDGSKDVVDLRASKRPLEKPSAPVPVESKAPPPPPEFVPAIPDDVAVDALGEVKAPKASKPEAVSAPVKQAALPPPVPEMVKPPSLPMQRRIVSPAPVDENVGNESQAPLTPPPPSAITKAQALSVALDYAPPSKDMEVFVSEFEGKTVFAVVFETEEGFHEVLVDSQTAKVLKSRPSENFSAQTRPGHLPSQLR